MYRALLKLPISRVEVCKNTLAMGLVSLAFNTVVKFLMVSPVVPSKLNSSNWFLPNNNLFLTKYSLCVANVFPLRSTLSLTTKLLTTSLLERDTITAAFAVLDR